MYRLAFSTKLILGLAVIALTIGYFSLPWEQLFRSPLSRRPAPVACTMDVRACSDGSYVGRVAPRCEFAPCPAQTQRQAYDSEGLRLSFRYPEGYTVDTTHTGNSYNEIDIFQSGHRPIPEGDLSGDVTIVVRPNPRRLPLAQFYDGRSQADLFTDAQRVEQATVAGRAATKFTNVIGLTESDIIVVSDDARIIEVADYTHNRGELFTTIVGSLELR